MAHSILSEGPYGPLRREGEEFQTVVMISGGAPCPISLRLTRAGSGVSWALPRMRDIVRRAAAMMLGQHHSAVVTQRVCVVA